ncbi:hypothetical protein HMPREF9622_00871 [Cutibacterium modestum HL037PA3]|nr:hypothetical protein HMPREF9621_00486 [Cutibacterium modestum HL037PA2]EFT16011.1 hypothetical protein HMPREF9622_00871 [Cutibacterium modestum HL037PA3]
MKELLRFRWTWFSSDGSGRHGLGVGGFSGAVQAEKNVTGKALETPLSAP